MQVFKVDGMTCDHCTRAVTQAVKALDPTSVVAVDRGAGRVEVTSVATAEQIVHAIVAEGYAATLAR